MRYVLALTLVLTLAACGPGTSHYPYAEEPNPAQREYVIGVSDSLRVSVWKNPELTTETRVRPDGTITMPLIGDVVAAGRTPTELKQAVSDKLRAYIREDAAVVTVAVLEVNSYRVTVAGQVQQPGMYASRDFLTVADAIALAGGPNRFASPDEAVLIRRDPRSGQVRRIPIDYSEIAKGKALEQNLVLMAGDTIFVP